MVSEIIDPIKSVYVYRSLYKGTTMSKINEDKDKVFTRRDLLKGTAMVVTGLMIAPAIAIGASQTLERKVAKATMTKSEAAYQDKPLGNHQCSNCAHFIPGASPKANGTCEVVEGSITPHGWCVVYTPKKV